MCRLPLTKLVACVSYKTYVIFELNSDLRSFASLNQPLNQSDNFCKKSPRKWEANELFWGTFLYSTHNESTLQNMRTCKRLDDVTFFRLLIAVNASTWLGLSSAAARNFLCACVCFQLLYLLFMTPDKPTRLLTATKRTKTI